MKKTRILYFMPDPPTKRNHGNRTHAMQLLEYFTSRADLMEVDYMGVREWGWHDWDVTEFKKTFPNFGLVVSSRAGNGKEEREDQRIAEEKQENKDESRSKYFFKYKLPNFRSKQRVQLNEPLQPLESPESPQIADFTTLNLQTDFNNLLKEKKYDVIIISYVIWANLVRNNPLVEGIKLINDTHDFMTAQYKYQPGFQLGKAFEQEIELLSLFDEIWSQSSDESYLFSQFLKKTHRFVPIMFDEKNALSENKSSKKKYDLIYVGSDNDNNKKSINWFFDSVYPLLPKNLNICIIGLVCNHFPSYKNVEKHLFVENLATFYQNSKISICPMLDGTGVKVKVVEAMSFGLPTVCNLRGLDGLPMKFENGCLRADTPEDFADSIMVLLSDDAFRNTMSMQAKAMFSKFFTKSIGYKILDSVFDSRKLEESKLEKEKSKKVIFSENLEATK